MTTLPLTAPNLSARTAVGGNGTINLTAAPMIDPALVSASAMATLSSIVPRPEGSIFNPTGGLSHLPSNISRLVPGVIEEEAEGDDEMLPAMADDDYSAQLSWQSQSKDNLKCASTSIFSHSHSHSQHSMD